MKIKIGYYEWEVKFVEELNESHGLTNKEDKVIWISILVIILILFFYSGFVREDFK